MISKHISHRFNLKKVIDAICVYIIILAITFIFVFPITWLILASFSKSGSIYSFDGFFPTAYGIESFKNLFTDTGIYNYPRWFLNTLFIASMSCLIGTFLTILTAYTMSRLRFKSRKTLMKVTLILGMFPSFMSMIAIYILMTQFNLINNLWGLILIYSASAPLGYMVQKGFFDTIPYEMDEAAMMHGANKFQIFLHITLPIAKPMIVYTALTSFTWPWSDYILPKLLLNQKDLYTVAVGLMSLGDDQFSRFAAGSIFIAVPIVILYFLLSKYMVSGLAAGSVKG
ncbi:MAG: ABC transporter permease subunit [Bacilli bacterium]|nr:ABC transporter permease subunit [Bacilli bacterium]